MVENTPKVKWLIGFKTVESMDIVELKANANADRIYQYFNFNCDINAFTLITIYDEELYRRGIK